MRELILPPTLSVFTPIFNQSASLGAAIESVLDQGAGDWELVIGDNASDEMVGEVVNRYSDPRIRYLRWPDHVGMAANFNRTAASCSGDWILPLGGDDRLRAGCLAEIVRLIQRSPDGRPVAALVAAARRVYPDGRLLGDEHYGIFGRPLARIADGAYGAADWLSVFPLAAEGNERLIVVRRDVVQAMGRYYADGADGNYGDVELAVTVATFGEVLSVGREMIDITFWAGSATSGWRDANLRLGERQTQLEVSLRSAVRSHLATRSPTRREWRSIDTAIAWSHLRRALRHRRDPHKGAWTRALRDVARAIRISPRVALSPRGLLAMFTATFVPVGIMERGRGLVPSIVRRRGA